MPASDKPFVFTEARLKALPEQEGRVRYRDAQLPGLILRVTAGSKTFAYRIKVTGRDVEVTLGRWPAITVESARKKALEVAQDPVEAAQRRRERLTEGSVAEAWEAHLRGRGSKLRPATRRDYDLVWRLVLEPAIGSKRVSDVTATDCQRMVARAEAKHGAAMARKAVAIASLLFNRVIKDEFGPRLQANPTRGIARPKIEPRRRFLDAAELGALLRGLNAEPKLWRVFWLCCLLAPLRRGNVAAAKWSDLMLDPPAPRWLVEAGKAKGGKLLAMPIVEPLAALLRDWRLTNHESPYVFPSGLTAGPRKESHHIVSVQHAWKRALLHGTAVRICDALAAKGEGTPAKLVAAFNADVEAERNACMGEHRERPGNPLTRCLERLRERAKVLGIDAEALELKDCTPHDLRRTAASWAVQGGASLAIVAASLGHADTRVTEAHYGHLSDSPVRGMLDANAERILATVKP